MPHGIHVLIVVALRPTDAFPRPLFSRASGFNTACRALIPVHAQASSLRSAVWRDVILVQVVSARENGIL